MLKFSLSVPLSNPHSHPLKCPPCVLAPSGWCGVCVCGWKYIGIMCVSKKKLQNAGVLYVHSKSVLPNFLYLSMSLVWFVVEILLPALQWQHYHNMILVLKKFFFFFANFNVVTLISILLIVNLKILRFCLHKITTALSKIFIITFMYVLYIM